MSIGIVHVDTVPGAVGVIEVGWTVPLVTDKQVHIQASIAPIHVVVVVIVLGWQVVIVVVVVNNSIIGTILIQHLVENLVVVLQGKLYKRPYGLYSANLEFPNYPF